MQLQQVSGETPIRDAYLRAVECTRMGMDERVIAWVCYPEHLTAKVRTRAMPWGLLDGQGLLGSQSGPL